MRNADEKLLNSVQRPEAYREVVVSSEASPIVLSVWDGQPDQAAVVFLPGTMTHPLFYEEFLDALNREGLNVVGVHSQSHGKSPRSRRPLTFTTLVANANDAVAWTRHEYSGCPIAVIGSSQGGIVAMALAASGQFYDVVIAHNILDPSLASSIEITRFPHWLRHAYPALVRVIRAAGRVAPGIPVPFNAYLDIGRVCRDPKNAEYFYTDPLGRRSYPLGFMASLFSADLTGMRNGSINCPVVVIAGRGDPLFPLAYTRTVYESIVTPRKELVVVESKMHLLLNEDLDLALPPILERLSQLRGAPTLART